MTSNVNVAATISRTRIREELQHHPVWWALSVALAVGGAALGTWVLDGWLSFVVSLLLAVLGFYVGVRAAVLVIERDHFGPFK
jgi:divalent metal cation (Fe/Co/Zn/Cd) transporter